MLVKVEGELVELPLMKERTAAEDAAVQEVLGEALSCSPEQLRALAGHSVFGRFPSKYRVELAAAACTRLLQSRNGR